MRHALSKEPWQNLLPESYGWLAKAKFSSGDAQAKGAHHLVAVRPGEGEDDKFDVNAPKFDAGLRKGVADALNAIGWRPAAGPCTVAVDGHTVTVVPQSSVKTSANQIARQFGLDGAKAVGELRMKHLVIADAEGLPPLEVFAGYTSGLYSTNGFKGTRKSQIEKFPEQVTLGGSSASDDDVRRQVSWQRAEAIGRFLQDAPPNYINPVKWGEIAQDLGKELGAKVTVYGRDELEKFEMGSYLSVADGGRVDPRMMVWEFDGSDNSQTAVLVGKGLTFDAGGISIKPSAGMEEMKYDMSGGAAVTAAAVYFAKEKPPVKTICVVGASENIPAGTPTVPSDMVRACNGKTIEVLNTDAEGRLVLADCLAWAAKEYKPALMVDAATLTGAVLHGLGSAGAAVMSPDQDTADLLLGAARDMGEPLWQLPMWPELSKEVKGEVTDLRNIAKPNVRAGTIVGGVFLKEFVGETKWAHLDIAGTAWNCQATGYPGKGGSIYGMRTMVGAVLRLGK